MKCAGLPNGAVHAERSEWKVRDGARGWQSEATLCAGGAVEHRAIKMYVEFQ